MRRFQEINPCNASKAPYIHLPSFHSSQVQSNNLVRIYLLLAVISLLYFISASGAKAVPINDMHMFLLKLGLYPHLVQDHDLYLSSGNCVRLESSQGRRLPAFYRKRTLRLCHHVCPQHRESAHSTPPATPRRIETYYSLKNASNQTLRV